MLAFVFGLIIAGGTVVWLIEDRIDTFGDGVWWALVTTTTVGYGDIAPGDAGGGSLRPFTLAGIGTLGMITGSIGAHFTGIGVERPDLPPDVQHVRQRLDHWATLSIAERRRVVRLLEQVTEDEEAAGPV